MLGCGARLRYDVSDLGQCQCHCQVDFIAVNELIFPHRPPLRSNNAHGPSLLIRRERSVTVELKQMCQIPTGRPLTSSYVWHFSFLIATVTNGAFRAKRQWGFSLLLLSPHFWRHLFPPWYSDSCVPVSLKGFFFLSLHTVIACLDDFGIKWQMMVYSIWYCALQ